MFYNTCFRTDKRIAFLYNIKSNDYYCGIDGKV